MLYGDWPLWPETERKAVADLLDGLWPAALPANGVGMPVASWFWACVLLGREVDALLEGWLASPVAAAQIAEFVVDMDVRLPRGDVSEAPVDGAVRRRVASWLLSDAVETMLLTAAGKHDPEWLVRVSWALDTLRDAEWA